MAFFITFKCLWEAGVQCPRHRGTELPMLKREQPQDCLLCCSCPVANVLPVEIPGHGFKTKSNPDTSFNLGN